MDISSAIRSKPFQFGRLRRKWRLETSYLYRVILLLIELQGDTHHLKINFRIRICRRPFRYNVSVALMTSDPNDKLYVDNEEILVDAIYLICDTRQRFRHTCCCVSMFSKYKYIKKTQPFTNYFSDLDCSYVNFQIIIFCCCSNLPKDNTGPVSVVRFICHYRFQLPSLFRGKANVFQSTFAWIQIGKMVVQKNV